MKNILIYSNRSRIYINMYVHGMHASEHVAITNDYIAVATVTTTVTAAAPKASIEHSIVKINMKTRNHFDEKLTKLSFKYHLSSQ